MAKGLNKVMIIGSLGRAAEMRYTPTGRPITSFSVVVERKGAQAEGAVDWFTVVAWDGLAESCNEQLECGMLVYVEGRLQTRGFQRGGQQHYRSEVVAEAVIPLEGASSPEVEAQEEDLPAPAEEVLEEAPVEVEAMEATEPESAVGSQDTGDPVENEADTVPPEADAVPSVGDAAPPEEDSPEVEEASPNDSSV